jgi:hypothetical protein
MSAASAALIRFFGALQRAVNKRKVACPGFLEEVW